MDSYAAVEMGREAVTTAIIVVAPLLGIGLILAIVLGLLQSLFQVHDQTVSYVPKVLLMLVVLIMGLPWITQRLMDYSRRQFESPVGVIQQVTGRFNDPPGIPIPSNEVAPINRTAQHPQAIR